MCGARSLQRTRNNMDLPHIPGYASIPAVDTHACPPCLMVGERYAGAPTAYCMADYSGISAAEYIVPHLALYLSEGYLSEAQAEQILMDAS